jgi:hypothetical protein
MLRDSAPTSLSETALTPCVFATTERRLFEMPPTSAARLASVLSVAALLMQLSSVCVTHLLALLALVLPMCWVTAALHAFLLCLSAALRVLRVKSVCLRNRKAELVCPLADLVTSSNSRLLLVSALSSLA